MGVFRVLPRGRCVILTMYWIQLAVTNSPSAADNRNSLISKKLTLILRRRPGANLNMYSHRRRDVSDLEKYDLVRSDKFDTGADPESSLPISIHPYAVFDEISAILRAISRKLRILRDLIQNVGDLFDAFGARIFCRTVIVEEQVRTVDG